MVVRGFLCRYFNATKLSKYFWENEINQETLNKISKYNGTAPLESALKTLMWTNQVQASSFLMMLFHSRSDKG